MIFTCEQVHTIRNSLDYVIGICSGKCGPENWDESPYETIIRRVSEAIAILDSKKSETTVTDDAGLAREIYHKLISMKAITTSSSSLNDIEYSISDLTKRRVRFLSEEIARIRSEAAQEAREGERERCIRLSWEWFCGKSEVDNFPASIELLRAAIAGKEE